MSLLGKVCGPEKNLVIGDSPKKDSAVRCDYNFRFLANGTQVRVVSGLWSLTMYRCFLVAGLKLSYASLTASFAVSGVLKLCVVCRVCMSHHLPRLSRFRSTRTQFLLWHVPLSCSLGCVIACS